MSSLGGSRGERNAKPKFSALDINSLYRTSRGESLEPSQQKNTVPRKHGMQSLGKVPSARRPPANLPSLKAETSSPSESSTTANDHQASTSIISASNTSPQQQKQHSSNNFSSVQSKSNNNNNNNNNQGGHHHQQSNSGNSSDRNSNSNSTTWSSVTTGGIQPQEGQPPLYQSPQFQHEFPSLDGTIPSGSKANQAQTNTSGGNSQNNQLHLANANHQNSAQQYDGPQMSLRPQTEPSTWMQQNMSGKGGGDSSAAANQQNSQQAPGLHVPPQLKALMPSFMYRSGGSNFSSPSSNVGSGFGLPSSQQQQNTNNSGNNQNNYRARNFGNSGNSNNNNSNNNNNNDHPSSSSSSSYQGRLPPRLQNQQNRNYDDYRGPPPPLLEPEAIIHRPIIRDEELERIENIAKDDGWAKDDTIDYNQKLNFSDDEVDPPLPATSSMISKDRAKQLDNKDDNKKAMSEDEKRTSWGKDRHDSRDSRYSQNGVDRRPVGALDTEILERVKQRREEEEKREMERRQAAAKKLQALEEKIHSKRANVSEDSDNATSTSLTQGKQERHVNQYGSKETFERRDRYDKYERVERDHSRATVDSRDRNFQSNLPPRFQRQQHGSAESRSERVERFERGGNSSYRNAAAAKELTNTTAVSSTTTSTTTASLITDSKNVPFAQQYDPRYIHQNMSKQLLQQKRRSDELLVQHSGGRRSNETRGRLDSDRDDYFTSRKISVSSNDADKPTNTLATEKSTSRERITSWVDELEDNEKSDTYTEKQKQLMKSIDAHSTSDYEPKQILQRSKLSVSDDSSSTMNKSLGNLDDKNDEKSDIKRGSESPKSWADHSANLDTSVEKGTDENNTSINKKDNEMELKKKQSSSFNDDQRRHDKRISRGGARDNNAQRRFDSNRDSTRDSRGGRSGYGSSSYGGRGSGSHWNRRGRSGGYGRYENMDYYSESEGSDYDDDYDKTKGKSAKDGKTREGFTARGEPSRRGRGANSNIQYNRRGQMHGSGNNKRIDNYGPPSSKSPFAGSDDQKDEYLADRERKISEHSTSAEDKSKSKMMKSSNSKADPSSSHKVSAKHNKGDDEKDAVIDNQKSFKTDERKDEQEQGHRKIFGGGKREDGDRSYSSQYSRGNTHQARTSSSGQQKSQQQQQKDDRSKPLSKPPGLSVKPRTKTNSTSSVGSNSERENTRPQTQRSNSNKDVQLQRGNNKTQSGIVGQTANTGNKAGSHWDSKKIENTQEKSLDDAGQQSSAIGQQQTTSDMTNSAKTEGNKQVLDGTTPPVNTIIFENTNYKTNPISVSNVSSQQTLSNQTSSIKRNTMSGSGNQLSGNTQKLQEDVFKATVPTSSSISDMMEQRVQQAATVMQQSQEQALNSALQSIDFNKADVEYEKDMKFNFTFGSDLSSQITSNNDVDKSNKQQQANLQKAMQHVAGNVQSNIISGSTVDLNMKIASVKKVWDVMPTVMEHANNDAVVESAAAQIASNVASFQHQHQHQLHQFAQSHANMSHVQHALSSSNNYSNFGHEQNALDHFNKATGNDQGIGGNDENSYISGNSSTNQHASVGQNQGQNQGHNQNMKHVSEVLGNNANICKVKPSQQQLQQASGLSGLSPPPQMQGTIPTAPQSYYQAASQAYGMSAIPSPPAAVVYNQSQAGMYNTFQIEAGRSQFSQYPTHYGATGNAPYANYMQTPPSMPTAPAHAEMYQNAFRTMGGAVQTPFNQSQQMNNPSTVLISSTSNTLMSTSVKPPSQIGAIGSKSAQPYGAQQYMGVYPQQGPIQNNSFYSNTAGQQTNAAFFGTAAAGTIQNYAGIFGGHGTPTGPSNAPQAQFGSQYPQQYRGPNAGNNSQQAGSAYMKQGGQGQSNAGQSQQGGPQGMQDSATSKGSSNNGTPDSHSTQQQSAQSSPSQHMKNFSGTNWDLQNQIFQQQQQQQQIINASLFHQYQQTVPPIPPIQRPNNNFDRMNMQMSGQQYYSNNRGQTSQTISTKKDESKN